MADHRRRVDRPHRRGRPRPWRRPRRALHAEQGPRRRVPGRSRRRAQARRRRDRQHRRRQPVPRRRHPEARRADSRAPRRHGDRRPPGCRPSGVLVREEAAPALGIVGRAAGVGDRRARHDVRVPGLQPRGGAADERRLALTYTLETIIQAGKSDIAVTSVPIRVNGKVRQSRLFKSIPDYVKRSVGTIFRIYTMHEPLRVFSTLASGIGLVGFCCSSGSRTSTSPRTRPRATCSRCSWAAC